MPYELSFTKRLHLEDDSSYLNDCCFGGDLVSDLLLPEIHQRYSQVQANQEDWRWFIWFRAGACALAVDIFCDDAEAGSFRVHLTARRKRWLILDSIVDTPELEALKALIVLPLERWVGSPIGVEHLNDRYLPAEPKGS